MRGLSHLIAFAAWSPLGIWLVIAAPSGRPRTAVAVFVAGIAVMFAVSALVHLRRWSPRTYEVLFRLDHTAIYLAIAGTATAVALLGLSGWPAAVVLWGTWAIAIVGIVVEWLPRTLPRGFWNTTYITMSWLTVIFLPALVARVGVGPVVLLLGGGLLYTVGAVIVAVQRPDPWPRWFGYHEIWHVLVIAAAVLHLVMVSGLVQRA